MVHKDASGANDIVRRAGGGEVAGQRSSAQCGETPCLGRVSAAPLASLTADPRNLVRTRKPLARFLCSLPARSDRVSAHGKTLLIRAGSVAKHEGECR